MDTKEINDTSLFSPYVNEIFSGDNKKDDSVDNSNELQNRMGEYLAFAYYGSDTTRDYHYSILKQAEILTIVFTILFSLVTVFICVMVGFIVLGEGYDAKLLIPLIISAVTDLFSLVLIVVMQNLKKSRDAFFDENNKAERFGKIIGLIHTIQDENNKLPFIAKIIEGYCSMEYGKPADK